MNRLPLKKQIQVLELLIEYMSMRAIGRTLKVSPNTVNRILLDAGRAAATYHDLHVRNVRAERVQCDEIWSFIYAKQAHVEAPKAPPPEAGDVWTWTALDVDSKLIVSYLVGDRGGETAKLFMKDLAARVDGKVELTTDAHHSYPAAVEEAFSGHVDYGTTEMEGVSNSFVERQNLTMRMSMKRFARRTNAHSKKFANHVHMVSLYFLYYNWCRIHRTIRCTPAMEAGLTDTLYDMEWLAQVIEAYA